MKSCFKKIMSLVLIFAVVTSLFTVFPAFAQEGFVIATLSSDTNVPSGKFIDVSASGLPSGAASVAIYRTADGVNKGDKLGEAPVTDGAASVQCRLLSGSNTFVAEALGSDGSVIAESNALTVNGYYENTLETRWDNIIAVYAGSELVNVKVQEHTFAPGEHAYSPAEVDMGSIDGGETVKVMLWASDSDTPLDTASEFGNEE